MANGDPYELRIEGIQITALPDGVSIRNVQIGRDGYFYSVDLDDIPIDNKYLTIQIKTKWI